MRAAMNPEPDMPGNCIKQMSKSTDPFYAFRVQLVRRFCGFVESYFVLIVIRFPSFEKLAVPYSARIEVSQT